MKRLFIFVILIAMTAFISMVSGGDVGITFSHRLHVQEMGAECADCHGAAESLASADNLMPDHDNCFVCHDESDTECSLCHTNADDPSGVPHVTSYIAIFPHKTHIDQNVKCLTCHKGVALSEEVSSRHLPTMTQCQTCHGDFEAVGYCQQCHAPGEQLAPATHSLDWRQSHGLTAHLQENSCATCHTEKYCLDCHQGDNLDRQIHGLNFVNNHSLAAKGKADNCYTCHEEQEFCVSCHRDQLVMPRNHNTAGWSNLATGGRHARQAKMDLDNCLACHNDNYGEPVCAQCHDAKN